MYFLVGVDDTKYKILDTSDNITETLDKNVVIEGIKKGLSVKGILVDKDSAPILKVYTEEEVANYISLIPLRQAIKSKVAENIKAELVKSELGTSLTITRSTTVISTMTLVKYAEDTYVIENKENSYTPVAYDTEKATAMLQEMSDSIVSILGFISDTYKNRVYYKKDL